MQKTCFGNVKGFFEWLISQYKSMDMDIVNDLIEFGVFDKESGQLLGTVGAGKHDDLHESELFYFLLPQYRGCGYATEAAKAITQWALANCDIPYLIATIETNNVKSQNVVERCGYQRISMDRRTDFVATCRRESILFSVLSLLSLKTDVMSQQLSK